MKINKNTCLLLILTFLLKLGNVYGQTVPYDMTIHISDRMVNKLLQAIGSVSDKGEYQVKFYKGDYEWKVENPKIKLQDGKALFIADVIVESGPLRYTDQIEGNLDVSYNTQKNQIIMVLGHAYFDIKAKILGKEILIKTLDLASFYTTPFEFEGPLSYQESFDFEMPDGSIKKLQAVIQNFDLKVIPGYIQLKANINFVDPTKVKPAIQKPAPVTKPEPVAPPADDKASKKARKKAKKEAKKKNKSSGYTK